VGIQIGNQFSPPLRNNNIYGNELNVKLTGKASAQINLPNNWWGTADQSAISQIIYDYKNDFNFGTVNFTPFLTAQIHKHCLTKMHQYQHLTHQHRQLQVKRQQQLPPFQSFLG